MGNSKRTQEASHSKGDSSKISKCVESQIQSSGSDTPNSTGATHSQPCGSSTVDSIGESPSTEPKSTGLTEEDAKKMLETLKKRSRSWVWDHFERYIHFNSSTYELRAKCMYCPKADYASDTTNNGTTTMIHHLDKCKAYPPNKAKVTNTKQKVLTFENPATSVGFNQKEITKACVEMVITDELPFSFVEGKGFRRLMSKACPKWRVPCRQTIARDVLNMYYVEKRELKHMLCAHRVCITTDTWTSCQNINYMVVTAHFIDAYWMLHKKIINFCVIPNHKGDSIARLLEECLLDWGIEKLLTITVDNASANDSGLSDLIRRINRWQSFSAILLGGENLHVRCVAHILNLIVKEGLSELNSCIQSIRHAIRYVRSSPQRLESFKRCVEKVKIFSKGLVVMDVPTRWNTTFLMLESALKFRSAFDRLRDEDSGYESYFLSDRKQGPPNEEDWKNADMFASFLKPFYEVTLRACCSNTPTIHHAFMDVFKIYGLLNEPSGIEELDSIRSFMLSKYNKYWGDLQKVNKYFFLAIVPDPRAQVREGK